MIIPKSVDFREYMDFVGEQESQEIHSAGHYLDNVIALINQGDGVRGDLLPWGKTHDKLGLRTGELSVWAGYNGHKKSLLLGYVMMHLAKTCRVAIASMEMSPAQTLYRMACQAAGCKASEGYYRKFDEWADPRIVIYDQLDMVPGERILGFVNYAATKLDCRHIVIDSLTKCGIAKDDTNTEKDFVDRLQWIAKTLQVGIHLVCHMRKPHDSSEPKMPTKYDVRGAGEISDLADNVFIVHSDMRKKKLQDKAESGTPLTSDEQVYMEKPDQYLSVQKQRNGEWEGTWGFWHKNYQFLSAATAAAQNFDLRD